MQARERDQFPPASRLPKDAENVWEWVALACQRSPIQPIANLGQGSIDFNPPQFLIDAHTEAISKIEVNDYGPTQGLPRLTRALSATCSKVHGRTLDPCQEISIHCGATEALLCSVMAFIEPGDEVIVPEPTFNLYENQIRLFGGIVRYVTMTAPPDTNSRTVLANEWKLEPGELRKVISPNTKMLILTSPHNPLGKAFSAEELLEIGKICTASNALILSDEAWEHLDFSSNFCSMASLGEPISSQTIVIGSAGKAFNAAAWRVGWAIGHKELIKHIQTAHILLTFNAPGPAQEASAIGLERGVSEGFWQGNRKRAQDCVSSLCGTIQELKLPYTVPAGAPYIFLNTRNIHIPPDYSFPPNVTHRPRDWKLAWFLIQEIGLATIPGSAFYSTANDRSGRDCLRLFACKSDQGLQDARLRLRKLAKWIKP